MLTLGLAVLFLIILALMFRVILPRIPYIVGRPVQRDLMTSVQITSTIKTIEELEREIHALPAQLTNIANPLPDDILQRLAKLPGHVRR